MKCSVCGSELPEGSKFCVYCGNAVKPAAPAAPEYMPSQPSYRQPTYQQPSYQQPTYQQPSYQQPSYQQPTYQQPTYQQPAYPAPDETVVVAGKAPKKAKKKKSKAPLAILGAVAAVLVIVLAVALVLMNRPGVKVPMALAKSLEAYSGIADSIGLTDATDFIAKDQAYAASMTVTYQELSEVLASQMGVDMTQFEDSGIRMDTAFSLKDRLLSGTLSLVQEDKDLVSAEIGIDDEVAWVSVPKLTQKTYGLNTTTLGKDLYEMGALEDEEAMSLGFHYFELMELLLSLELPEDIQKAMAQAAADLSKQIVYESDGSKDIKVNGKRTSCQLYNVTIPEDALADYLEAMEEPIQDSWDYYVDYTVSMMEAIGMPQEYRKELRTELQENLDVDYVLENLAEALEEIGDVELELYLKGGYVMAVLYELEIDGEALELTLNMGGGDNYADDFSLVVDFEDETVLELSSSGNHTGKGGEFTDKTVLEINDGYDTMTYTLKTSYEPKAKADNFSFQISVDTPSYMMGTVGLEGEGQLTLDKNSLAMDLEELTVSTMDVDMVTLGLSYSISEYTGADSAGSVQYVNKLTEDDLTALAMEISTNAQTLLTELMETYPVISELIYAQAEIPSYDTYGY